MCGFVRRCDIWKIIIIWDGYSLLLYDKRNPLCVDGITLFDTLGWKWHIYMNEFVIQMRWDKNIQKDQNSNDKFNRFIEESILQ